MKTQFRTAIILCALAACMACGTAQASAISPFSFYFDENGTGHFILSDGSNVPTEGFAQQDPNTDGRLALTYRLPNTISPGIIDVLDSSGALSDAISFYNSGGFGFMAFYSTLPGTDLADTISNGFVPLSGVSVTEVGDMFAYFSGGSPGVNNDYYGTSSGPASVPDGGSTLALLSGAFALVGAFSRKLRK